MNISASCSVEGTHFNGHNIFVCFHEVHEVPILYIDMFGLWPNAILLREFDHTCVVLTDCTMQSAVIDLNIEVALLLRIFDQP